ncbi:MAG: glycosyltransferase family protein [Proteobacteria bacterium]|nr:glycosyltransferase family protein [Pseudomonadota bacterium]
MPKFIASIEARMGSTRLPGKILEDVGGVPVLTRLLRRLRRAKRLDGIVLATTVNPADDAIEEWAEGEGLDWFRGSEDDVLARVVDAQQMMRSDIVVEVCGDTPLLDPEVIDMAIEAFAANTCHVVTTTRKKSFPDGIDAEVFRLSDLERVAATVTDRAVREHVSLYFYQHPERYRIHHLPAPPAWRRPDLRLVLDEADDLALIREIYTRLEPEHGDEFGTVEIIRLFDSEPELMNINRPASEKVAP